MIKDEARRARLKMGLGEKLTEDEKTAYNKWLSNKMGFDTTFNSLRVR